MSKPTLEDVQSGAVKATAIDLETGRTQDLTVQPGSLCHFFEPFDCGGYEVRLRLDWGDERQGCPTLDADFYDLETRAMLKSMKGHSAHHTPALQGQGRVYQWEFADQSVNLQVTLTWSVSGTCVATSTASCTARVIRAGEGT